MEEQVTMTPEERQEYEEFKAERARKQEEEARKMEREEYARLVDDEVATAVAQLGELSEQMRMIKDTIYDNFRTILRMKSEVMHLTREGGQHTHTFTSSDSRYRITLGCRTVDDYRDTVEDGIAIVTKYLQSLAKDQDSADLVETVMHLLSRNKRGVLQPSRVIQLRQLAERRKDDVLLEGVKIIEESYQPYTSKTFVQAQVKEATGWSTIPLNMTEV